MNSIQKIILGTAQMGISGYGINNDSSGLSKDDCIQVLSYAYDAGIRTLDTAAAYGNAEEIIGDFNRVFPEKRFHIITKLNPSSDINLKMALDQSLWRLNQASIDTLLFHSLDDFEKRESQIEKLLLAKQKGLINRIGVSVYSNEEVIKLLSLPYIDVIQLPYNLLDNQSIRGKTISEIKSTGKLVHTRSVFLQGLFFRDLNQLPEYLKSLKNDLIFLQTLINQTGIDISTAALVYALNQPDIDGVLVGVDSIEQLKLNLNRIDTDVPRTFIDKVNAIKVKHSYLLSPVNWK